MMREIKEDIHDIEDELKDARKYILKASKEKLTNKSKADMHYKLANEELNHAMLIHGETVKSIEAYRKEHGDPPAYMQEEYDEAHEHFIQDVAEIKVMISMYAS